MTDRRLLLPVQKLLLDAADYIEKHGWDQGQYFGEERRACMVGAMIAAADPKRTLRVESVERKIRPAINYMLDRLGESPIDWNDRDGRTKQEVMQALRDGAAAYTKD